MLSCAIGGIRICGLRAVGAGLCWRPVSRAAYGSRGGRPRRPRWSARSGDPVGTAVLDEHISHLDPDAPPVVTVNYGMTRALVLNRGYARQALSPGMVRTLTRAVGAFEASPSVYSVLLRASPLGQTYCSGEDLRLLHRAATAYREQDPGCDPTSDDFAPESVSSGSGSGADPSPAPWAAALTYLQSLYQLTYLIGTAHTPLISVMDGAVVGGSAGTLAGFSIFRIATERTTFGLPETSLGLIPGGGMTYLLALLGPIGLYLGLTGARIGGSDLVRAGLATHYIESEQVPHLAYLLSSIPASDPSRIQDVLDSFHSDDDRGPRSLLHGTYSSEHDLRVFEQDADDPPGGAAGALFGEPAGAVLETAFGPSATSLEAVLVALSRDRSPWGHAVLQALDRRSPLALQLTFGAIQQAGQLQALTPGERMQPDYAYHLRAALDREYTVLRRLIFGGDFLAAAAPGPSSGPGPWNPPTIEHILRNHTHPFLDTILPDQYRLKLRGHRYYHVQHVEDAREEEQEHASKFFVVDSLDHDPFAARPDLVPEYDYASYRTETEHEVFERKIRLTAPIPDLGR